ncbi:MAG: four helix bundle protein [Candidatus Korobacteraceae bacterium]
MQDFRKLNVWGKSHKLTLNIYRITEGFPRSEMFGLTSQIRRASSSIATNLAEGCGRTQAEFGKFVQIAFGSACEVEYQLLLARDLGLLSCTSYEGINADLIEVKRMLTALLQRIQHGVIYATSKRSGFHLTEQQAE